MHFALRRLLGQGRFNAQTGWDVSIAAAHCRPTGAMRPAALLALLVFGLLACAQLAASLPSQSAVLKRKRGKKRAAGEQRQLAERDWVAASVQRYLSNQELGEWLAGYEKRCKGVAKLSTIGSSAEGRCGHLPPLPPPALLGARVAWEWRAVWGCLHLQVVDHGCWWSRRISTAEAAGATPAAAPAAAAALAYCISCRTTPG